MIVYALSSLPMVVINSTQKVTNSVSVRPHSIKAFMNCDKNHHNHNAVLFIVVLGCIYSIANTVLAILNDSGQILNLLETTFS